MTGKMWLRTIAIAAGLCVCIGAPAQANRTQVTDAQGSYPAKPKPLISLDSLKFLEGTWTAQAPGQGSAPFGSYSFVRELNGHMLARHSTDDPSCKVPTTAECARRDVFFVFQESPGAPLKALYLDTEGHLIHYGVDIRREESAYNRRDVVVFLSEASGLGPRFRLSYELNTDTQTAAVSLSGRFETLLANGEWHTDMQWIGIRQQ